MNFRKTCGGCYYCQNKMEHFCERVTPFVGVMADYGSFKESLVYKLPEDLPLDAGAFLEPLSIAVHAVDIAKVKTGDSVIITGGGPIGLLIRCRLPSKPAPPKSWFPNRSRKNARWPSDFGADVTVDPMNEDLLAIANKFTDGRGFNVCIEATGITALARQLVMLVGTLRQHRLGRRLSREQRYRTPHFLHVFQRIIRPFRQISALFLPPGAGNTAQTGFQTDDHGLPAG
jgi:threonine dehydrogenase-like Zn-dependent dehydrogenase